MKSKLNPKGKVEQLKVNWECSYATLRFRSLHIDTFFDRINTKTQSKYSHTN